MRFRAQWEYHHALKRRCIAFFGTISEWVVISPSTGLASQAKFKSAGATLLERHVCLMKAWESFLDKGGKDNGLDLLSGRSLSREVNISSRVELPGQERQKLTVAGNYFALACPIMPIGLLGIFLLLGKLDSAYGEKPEKLTAEETQRERGELTQALYLAAMKKKLESERKLDADKLLGLRSRPIDSLFPLGEKKPPKKKQENSLMLQGKRSDRISGPSLLNRANGRAQSDLGKLVKAKMQLQSHLEQMSKEQDFGAVCRVSARIELLEKALKKLGC